MIPINRLGTPPQHFKIVFENIDTTRFLGPAEVAALKTTSRGWDFQENIISPRPTQRNSKNPPKPPSFKDPIKTTEIAEAIKAALLDPDFPHLDYRATE